MVVKTKNRFVGFMQGVLQFALLVILLATAALLYLHYFSDWKTYSNKALGIEFKYPREMQLSESDGRLTLLHQIPYQNKGDCDMVGDEKVYDKLTDFQMSFEFSLQREKLDYVDGRYSAGILSGDYQYYGAEGCGDTNYYFPLASSTLELIVRRANIQILSGIRNNVEEREEILTIPGAISKEKNDQYFQQILSSFRYTPVATGSAAATSTKPTSGNSTSTKPTGSKPVVPSQPLTGVKGKAMLGPTCPVMKNPPDPKCADKPYQTNLVLTTEDGTKVLKQFSSDQKGQFSVDIGPGRYEIRSVANALPYCSSGVVEVKDNTYTEITVSCDTGIR